MGPTGGLQQLSRSMPASTTHPASHVTISIDTPEICVSESEGVTRRTWNEEHEGSFCLEMQQLQTREHC